MAAISHWVSAFRLRTLPLAFSCILMGTFVAAREGFFSWGILALSLLTTLFLQILSNLANDYGDSVSGVDNKEREGPSRAVQEGKISAEAMKKSLYVFSGLSFVSGSTLLILCFGINSIHTLIFLLIGFGAIAAAIKYTVGSSPYGYAGFGDLFVLIFFGLVGVLGSHFLHAHHYDQLVVLPALSCGLLAVGVLNVNNIRDIESDEKAGKKSIPVRIGKPNALRYHFALILLSWVLIAIYVVMTYDSTWNLLFIVTLPFFVLHLWKLVKAESPKEIDPLLKQLAISTMLFVLSFGLGLLI